MEIYILTQGKTHLIKATDCIYIKAIPNIFNNMIYDVRMEKVFDCDDFISLGYYETLEEAQAVMMQITNLNEAFCNMKIYNETSVDGSIIVSNTYKMPKMGFLNDCRK